MTPIIPNVEGLTLAQAAPAYAGAGWFIAPTKPTDYRNPGSFLGAGWPRHTSRDVAKIERFWARHPQAGIALHMGRSGAVAADIDVDILPAGLECLNLGAIQLSRASARGHRIFATDQTFCSGKLKFNGMEVGDVRSGNTVIMAQPTPHTRGGQYRWLTTGPVPALPDDVRALLVPRQEAGAGGMSLEEFCAKYVAADPKRQKKLQGLRTYYSRSTKPPHDAMLDILLMGLGEARIGYVNARQVIATFREVWPKDRPASEFQTLCADAANYVEAQDIEEIKMRSDRAKGSDSRRYSGKFRRSDDKAKKRKTLACLAAS